MLYLFPGNTFRWPAKHQNAGTIAAWIFFSIAKGVEPSGKQRGHGLVFSRDGQQAELDVKQQPFS